MLRQPGDRLIRPALAVWASWLGLVAVLGGLLLGLVWHPHFLPVAVCLVALVGSWLVLVAKAGWRIVRGPARVSALGWLLLGSAPAWFEAGHIAHGLRIGGGGRGSQVYYTPFFKLLLPLGESVMDLEARFRYPVRTVGARVVMISAPIDRAVEQVEAMDRHVGAVEARLGRRVVGRIHWARGPLFGMEAKALFGLCMGSRPGKAPLDAEGLANLDRHEVAHCVASAFCPATAQPPALLSEGWAEANMGLDESALEARLWDWREQGRSGTLARLTGPDWYGRHEWPVYVHGAPLVNFLLREFGPDRFLKLYTTSRPWSIDADCRNALGVGLDELDQRFWADLDRRTGREPTRVGRLRRLRVGPGVTPEAWKTFLDAYLVGADRLIAPYAESRVIGETVLGGKDSDGKPSSFRRRVEFVRSGGLRGYREKSTGYSRASVAHPLLSFSAQRQGPAAAWIVRRFPDGDANRAYRQALANFEQDDAVGTLGPFLLLQAEEWANRSDLSTIRVVGLDRFEEGGKPWIRVRLEDSQPIGEPWWRTMALVVAVEDHYAARAVEEVFADGSRSLGRFGYEDRAGVPMLREFRSDRRMVDGEHRSYELKVVERHFEATPEADLAESRWLEGPRQVDIGQPEIPSRSFAHADFWCGIMGVVSLLGGSLILVKQRPRPGQVLGG